MPDDSTEELCPSCQDQQLFSQVRDYIRENDVRDWEVAEHFGIPVTRVRRWIEEGRIQYNTEQSPREVIMSNYCQICGKPTHFGTICPACMTEQKRKERHGMVGVNSLLRDEENRMQFIGNKEHKES